MFYIFLIYYSLFHLFLMQFQCFCFDHFFPKHSLLYGVLAFKGQWKLYQDSSSQKWREKWFSQTFYRHRRFWTPLLLQRGGRSHTRAAATATFSSPMSIKRPPNSLFWHFSKNHQKSSNNTPKTFSESFNMF